MRAIDAVLASRIGYLPWRGAGCRVPGVAGAGAGSAWHRSQGARGNRATPRVFYGKHLRRDPGVFGADPALVVGEARCGGAEDGEVDVGQQGGVRVGAGGRGGATAGGHDPVVRHGIAKLTGDMRTIAKGRTFDEAGSSWFASRDGGCTDKMKRAQEASCKIVVAPESCTFLSPIGRQEHRRCSGLHQNHVVLFFHCLWASSVV